MKSGLRFNRLCLAGLLAFFGAVSVARAVSPYLPDADTLHLWHMDDPAAVELPVIAAVDSVHGNGPYNLNVTNGASLMAPGYNGALGGALDTGGNLDDIAYNDSGVYTLDQNMMGFNGAFTYEALIFPTFDPRTNATGRTQPMEIICFDSESLEAKERFFQFRMVPPVSNEQWSVEFANIGSYIPAEGTNTWEITEVVEDFSGDLSSWDSTVILDANGGTTNISAWMINSGLQLNTSLYDGIEQYAMIKSGVSLAVGEELRADIGHTLASQDIGLYVGGTPPVAGTRQDYIAVYARGDDGFVRSRGFDGNTGTEYNLVDSGGAVPYTGVFIARTDVNTYETGWYNATSRVVLVTRTPAAPNDGDVVGVYADVRGAGLLGTVTNIVRYEQTGSIISPEQTTETFSAPVPTFGLHFAAPSNWYHVAVTYNGVENSPNNLKLYWTKIGNTLNQLGTFSMTNDLANGATNMVGEFCVGNESRGTSAQNFEGRIDEVRISSIDRISFDVLNRVPYTLPEANTLLLFHFNETHDPVPENDSAVAYDAMTNNAIDLISLDDPVFGTNAYTGFGTAVGFDKVVNPGNRLAANENAPLPMSNYVDAATGAFTFEAVIQPQWTGAQGVGEHLNIMTAEGDGGTVDRPFQFRVQEDGITLRFDPIATRLNGGGTTEMNVTLPSTGPHALAAGNWYHVAIAYNGIEGQTDNVTFYWTRLDSGASVANVLTNFTQAGDLINPAHSGEFCVGNELRDNGGYAVEEFFGIIDEVRISSIARAASDFVFNDSGGITPYDILSLSTSDDNVTLVWDSQSGVTYSILRKTDLTSGPWTSVKSGIASAGDGSTSDTVTASGSDEEFYQIQAD